MATTITHNPKFQWSNHDLAELKREYYEIGTMAFLKKYKTGTQSLYRHLGRIPVEQRPKQNHSNRLKKKIERLENTTKVARMYEKKMQELEPPKYVGPWSQFIKS